MVQRGYVKTREKKRPKNTPPDRLFFLLVFVERLLYLQQAQERKKGKGEK